MNVRTLSWPISSQNPTKTQPEPDIFLRKCKVICRRNENLCCILTVEPDSFCPLLKSFYGYSIKSKYAENLHIWKFSWFNFSTALTVTTIQQKGRKKIAHFLTQNRNWCWQNRNYMYLKWIKSYLNGIKTYPPVRWSYGRIKKK